VEVTNLIKSLDLVKPALSMDASKPILTHFCFTNKKVKASTGDFYMSVKTNVDLELAIPGWFLYKFVSTLKNDIKFKINKNDLVTLTSGKSVNKLQGLPIKDFISPVIKGKPKNKLSINTEIINAIAGSLEFIGGKGSFPEYMGVMLTKNWVYATNARIITRAKVDLKLKDDEKVFLPKAFCVELIRSVEDLDIIEIYKDFIVAKGNTNNKLEMVHSISNLNFPDYVGTFKSFKEKMDTDIFKVSEDLLDCVNRINLMAQSLAGNKICKLKFGKDFVELCFDNKSFSNFNEVIEIKGCAIKDEVEMLISSLSSCVKSGDKFGLADNGKSKALYFLKEDLDMNILASLIG